MIIKNTVINTLTSPNAKNTITKLRDPASLLPVIMLEGTVTGGRTIQAQKRGGYTEARERLCEETIGAVFWLFGVKMFNKIGDWIGQHVLKMPVNFDVGKDALRTPFENVFARLEKDAASGKQVKQISKNALAGFKFGKIALSVIAATSFIGFVVPKFNQSITRNVISRNKQKTNETPENQQAQADSAKTELKHSSAGFTSLSEFKNKVSNKSVAFKGGLVNAELMATMAHNLENHPIYRLLATDTGIITGRTLNARNADERIEIPFRDGSSIYFYLFSTNHVISFLQKKMKFGNIAKLDPNSATLVDELMRQQLEKNGGKIDVESMQKNMLGSLTDARKNILDLIPFKEDVISLEELKKVKAFPKKLYAEAEAMSGLQPKQAKSGAVLSKQQVIDVLTDAEASSSDFLLKIYKQAFGEALTDETKYIPMKRIQSFRDHINDYVNTVVDYAKKEKSGIIDADVLKHMNNKNAIRYGGFFAAGFLISAAFLSTIIPKTQYMITKLRTGKNEFPGMEADGVRQKTHIKS